MFDLTSSGTKEISKRIFNTLTHARSPYFSKPFIYTLIVSAIVIFVSLTVGASRGSQVEIEVAEQALTEIREMASESTWLSIFAHNVSLVLITFIPLVGVVWMIYVQYNTGWYLGAMAKAYNVDYVLAISAIFTSIVGLIECSASIIALGESVFLVYSAIQGEFKEKLIQHSWKSIVIVISLFFVGGVVEPFLLGRP